MIDTLLPPMLTLVALTAGVWACAVVARVRECRQRGIPPQALASSRDASRLLRDTAALDNFHNLLELPLLFYLWCMIEGVRTPAPAFLLAGAWGFVLLRIAHSAVHLTHNHVLTRFALWTTSTLVLFALWAASTARELLAH